MKALRQLVLVTLALLTISCAASPRPVPVTPKPCIIPAFPDPPIIKIDVSGNVTDETMVDVGTWARAVLRYHDAVVACNQVRETPLSSIGAGAMVVWE